MGIDGRVCCGRFVGVWVDGQGSMDVWAGGCFVGAGDGQGLTDVCVGGCFVDVRVDGWGLTDVCVGGVFVGVWVDGRLGTDGRACWWVFCGTWVTDVDSMDVRVGGCFVGVWVDGRGSMDVWDESAHTHMCLGFTVVSLVLAQVLSGLLRPGLDSKIRPLFNFVHKLMGTAALVIAAAAIIYAYKITDFAYEMRRFGERTVAVWAGIFVFLEILHLAYKYFASRILTMRTDSDEYNLDKFSNVLEPDEMTPPSHFLLAIFILFICCSIAAALCMTIFF
ncbi:hypothetical protein Btru_075656 [Bulinus truncatus]|nr:hypothetical protein Btru_075656 [Bulinus truncatus]